jgi:hypothetical protein
MKYFSPGQIRFVIVTCAVVLALALWRYIQAH